MSENWGISELFDFDVFSLFMSVAIISILNFDMK